MVKLEGGIMADRFTYTGVVVGIGFFFAFIMMGISYLQNRYTRYSTHQSEEFNTASRSVKPGLIASGIVSAWTWAATLLQSSTVAYQYGVAGPFWYAAGATVQILMFAILACKVKQNAPRCHTYLEIIKARYGTLAHLVFMVFAFVTNILVGSQLLLGGSAVVTSLTGMPVYAAVFLIPVACETGIWKNMADMGTGVCAYVILGGLRATFICDYSHTLILMIIILYFMFNAYAVSPLIGSPGEMYELLKKAGTQRPIAGNHDGSYVTLKSNFGLVFGVIQLCSGSGTVFLDQAYWQRAIASKPSTAVRAYLLGGLAWFAIPFGFSTTLGLAAVALTDNPRFPTYPNVPTSGQVSSGLAAAFAAETLLGQGGAVALLVVLFMAVTSCASAELIAVSSLLTFDVYKEYIAPKAEPKQLVFVSHIMICVFGLTMSVFACIWHAASIDLGWLFLVMGLLIGGAVFPTAFAITWRKQTRVAAISGCLSGLAAGLTAWLSTAKVYYGEINIHTTGLSYPTLAGNLAAIMTGLIVTTTITLIKPDNFDWEITRSINAVVTDGLAHEGSTTPELSDSGEKGSVAEAHHHTQPSPSAAAAAASELPPHLAPTLEEPDDPSTLRRAFKLACISAFLLTFILDFLLPMPMFFSHYIFSKGFFTGWVVVSFLWVFASSAISCILPIWETRGTFGMLFRKIARDLGGRKEGG
ncbi:solute symporter family transporter [Pyrenophora seminiperda CCB06]|uniref:Solute symporter family transporter n=1 Tax=Pyrenophora seminiperda CCB06 TaxID=1302712 RepID=A0A3M7M8U2_9PLEO|nr:solute symporter family transporter [Pyrenophora seminiperda CCB06]